MERRPAVLIAIRGIVAAILAVASLWQLSEQDIYWQVRAGDEWLRTLRWPEQDTWSYSVPGAPWMNIQWLSTVLFRGAFGLGAEDALIALRGLLAFALLLLLGSIVDAVQRPETPWRNRAAIQVALLGSAYAALVPRTQVRSDFLVLLVFAALIRLRLGRASDRVKRGATIGLVALAANLHAGTAPFVVLLALTATACDDAPLRGRALDAALTVAAFFATPYGFRVLPLLWAHVVYYDHSVMQNPDHQALSVAYLRRWPGVAWIGLSLGGVAALVRGARPGVERAPAGLLRRTWHARLSVPGYERAVVVAVAAAALTALSINRVRAIPYQVVFLVPLLGRGHAALRLPRSLPETAAAGGAALAGLAAWTLSPYWGFGVNDKLFPVGSTRFLERTHPQANVMHTFAYGAYLVWYLRDYPLYVDTRETMYWPIQQEILNAYHSPAVTRALLEKYHVNTVMMPIPQNRYIPGVGFEDVVESYLPGAEWALVYFDKISFIALRRTPENAAIIREHEYRLLRPNLPANAYPLIGARNQASDERFEHELARCLGDEPESAYCLVAQVAWWRQTAPDRYRREARVNLERARAELPPGSAQTPTVQVELEEAFRDSKD